MPIFLLKEKFKETNKNKIKKKENRKERKDKEIKDWILFVL
jgi:hypothetical protein